MSLSATSGETFRPGNTNYVDEGIRELQKMIANVRRSVMWQNSRESLTLMAAWWILCLQFWLIIIYIVPLLPLLWAARSWSTEQPAQTPQKTKLSDDTFSKQQQPQPSFIIHSAMLVEHYFSKGVDYLTWSKDPLRTHRAFITLVYAYIFWVAGHQVADTRHIFLIIGTVGITWQSPWVIQLRQNPRYPVIRSVITALFFGPLQQIQENNIMVRAVTYQNQFAEADKRAADDASFTFVLYENQRAWPLGQWESKTLPVERAPWTDDANEPVPAKNTFVLPKPVDRTINDPSRPSTAYHKTWCWSWLDPEWRLDFSTRQVDELGWEYGTMAWTLFDRQPKKGWMSTRRRRWTRRARVEYHVEVNSGTTSINSLAHVPNNDDINTLTTKINNALPPLPNAPSPTSISVSTPQAAAATTATTTSTSTTKNTSPPQSPTIQSSFHESVSFISPPTSPRSSIYTFDFSSASRRESFNATPPTPRLSQSTVTVNGNHYPDKEEMRRRRGNSISLRSTGLTSPVLEERNRLSTQSLRKPSKDSRKPQPRREAVWKSIVRT
ncbi:integral peroxisomal membrane peroxin-domain-containing protein [Circinella umbellata]|nr:integral peroxisomal membrane peroxin-domain-containing protein [Circinella umbellata]